MSRDWMDTMNNGGKAGKSGFRDMSATVDKRNVRTAVSGKASGRRQQSQTIHLSDEVADELKELVAHLADEWGVPKNDVWQLALIRGLKAIDEGNGEGPTFVRQKRKIVLPDL